MCPMTHVECKIAFIELDNKVREVRSVLKRNKGELGHSTASCGILNSHISLLVSHLSNLFQSISNICIRPTQWAHCHHKLSCALIASQLGC